MESDKKKVPLRQMWSYCANAYCTLQKKLRTHIAKITSGIPSNLHSYMVHRTNIDHHYFEHWLRTHRTAQNILIQHVHMRTYMQTRFLGTVPGVLEHFLSVLRASLTGHTKETGNRNFRELSD
jgi:hypothetical protein